MSAVICGSLAYDTIMVFPDQFKNHILPDKVHVLNVSVLVPRMRREFGGCAGNIAYNLKLLGAEPLPMATVGQDVAPDRAHVARIWDVEPESLPKKGQSAYELLDSIGTPSGPRAAPSPRNDQAR